MCFPSDTPPNEEILDTSAWVYWYTPSNRGISYVASTYIDESYMFALRVPEDWLTSVTVRKEPYDQRSYSIVRPLTGEILFEVKILAVGESGDKYIRNGYTMFKTTGAYRFLYRANCDSRSVNYITSSFEIIY